MTTLGLGGRARRGLQTQKQKVRQKVTSSKLGRRVFRRFKKSQEIRNLQRGLVEYKVREILTFFFPSVTTCDACGLFRSRPFQVHKTHFTQSEPVRPFELSTPEKPQSPFHCLLIPPSRGHLCGPPAVVSPPSTPFSPLLLPVRAPCKNSPRQDTAARISTGSQAARSQRRLDRTPPASAKKRPARARPPGNVSAHPMGARGGAGPAAFPVLVLPRSRTASWEWQFRLAYRRRCRACSINNSHHQPHQALFLRENERMQGHQKSSIELVGSVKN